MSGVGSTNAMKKGSANNPFLAYSEADMQGYLNSAYTGCIVKYTGPAIHRTFSEQNLTIPEAAQNLVFTRDVRGPWASFDSGNMKIQITEKTDEGTNTWYLAAGQYINGEWKFSRYYAFNGEIVLTDSLSAHPTSIRKLWTVKDKWNNDYINDQGNLTFWTYGEDITFTIAPIDTDMPVFYDKTTAITIVPYKVNELYKVVYSGGEYYYEKFCHISDTPTTANSDYMAPGKTAFDFTGNLQTGNGSKVNPYLAYTVAELQSFPVGSFIKWLGPDKTVLDETTGQMLIQGEVYRAVEDGDVFQYVILPTLSNPGTAADLAQGKQLIDGEGKVVEGEAVNPEGKLAMDLFAKTITDINDTQGSITRWPAVYYTNQSTRAAFCTNCKQLSRVNLPNISSSTGTIIPAWAFYDCTNLKYVDIGYFNGIHSSAFAFCKNLREIKGIENVTRIQSNAFLNAKFVQDDEFVLPKFSKLTAIHEDYVFSNAELFDLTDDVFPALSIISGYGTFYGVSNITKISLTSLQTLSGYSLFHYCNNLKEINCPNLARIYTQNCFARCTKLSSVNLPLLSQISSNTFSGCTALKNISLPSLTVLSSYAFRDCTFSKIVLPVINKMIGDPFYYCRNLISVYLPNSVVCSATSNMFYYTPMRSLYSEAGYNYGSIYVPMSLLSQYQSASYWVNLSSRIVGLTDEEFASVLT